MILKFACEFWIIISDGISSSATEFTTKWRLTGEMPVPGPFVVSISRVIVVPLGINTFETIDLHSFCLHLSSDGCIVFWLDPNAFSMTRISLTNLEKPRGSKEAA